VSWQTWTRTRRADIHQGRLTERSLASCSRIGRHSLISGRGSAGRGAQAAVVENSTRIPPHVVTTSGTQLRMS
jgi:hypothetical protein